MLQNGIESIDALFQKYYGREYLAVKECQGFSFETKKNIRTIAMYYPRLSIGGVERVISLLTPMFIELGYKVVIITEETQPNKDYTFSDEVEIAVIPKKQQCLNKKSYLERASAIQGLIENQKIDAVCYHEASSDFLLYDLLTYKQNKVNFILIKHEYISQCNVHLRDLLYNQRYIFPFADKLIVLSEAERLFWKEFGIEAEYIYNPIGEYAISKSRKRKNEILWIGRLDIYQKQYMDVVPIMKRVAEKVPDALLKIYGSAYSIERIEKLEQEIKTEKLERNIQYCGYTTENVADVYAEAMIHLVTSAYESFPMNIYESRVNGLPLVLYKMPYLEMLKNGKGYIEVDNDDTQGAAEAIIRILTDDKLRHQLEEDARESVKVFCNEEVKKRWKNVFDSLSMTIAEKDRNDCEKEDIMKIILDTMMYHCHKGCITYQNRLLENKENAFQDKVKSMILMALRMKNMPIVIYPYGKLGKQVKQILNDTFKLQEAFVVDNHAASDEFEIKTVEQLQDVDCSKYWFVICSNSPKYYDEIRRNLQAVVPTENIVDLYPRI